MKLTEQQRIAACVFFGLACLCFVEDRKRNVWWYRWCVERGCAAPDRSLEAAVWWAIRFADKEGRGVAPDSAEGWLEYVEHVCEYRGRGEVRRG